MQRSILSSLLTLSIFLSPALRADIPDEPGVSLEQTGDVSPAPPAQDASPLATDPALEDLATDEEGTSVGQASQEGARAAKRKQLRNIAIAAVAVAAAVTALIVVSSNNGHREH